MAMKTRTYLSLKDPWFWEKLCFALPNVTRRDHPHGNQAEGDQRPQPGHEARRHPKPPEDGDLPKHNDCEIRVNDVQEGLDLSISLGELSDSRQNSESSFGGGAQEIGDHDVFVFDSISSGSEGSFSGMAGGGDASHHQYNVRRIEGGQNLEPEDLHVVGEDARLSGQNPEPVSYTHLTLPTRRTV